MQTTFRCAARRLIPPVILGVCLMASAWAQSLEIIDLKHRTAQEVIPVLQPLLEPGGALSGQDYKLFVRTSSANLAQLRAALAQIDTQAKQLFVSVRNSTQQEVERERAAVSATIRSGGISSATVRASDSSSNTQTGGIASVQVTEGSSAFITTGTSVPTVTAFVGVAGHRPWIVGSTSYQSLSSGFMVTPRMRGELVVLDIAQHDERVNGSNIEGQELTTQVSGRLGEWIQLGGINESATSRQSGILQRQYATRSDERSIWVKVEAR